MNRKVLYICEAVITLILLAFFIYSYNNRTSISIDMSTMSSDFVGYDETNDEWRVNAADFTEGQIKDGVTIAYGPYILLDTGSYTITIYYDSDVLTTASLTSGSASGFLHANTFYLSKNLNTVDYDFYLTRDASDLGISLAYSVIYGGEGNFALNGIEINENMHAATIPLFLWMLVVIVGNIVARLEQRTKKRLLVVTTFALAASIPLFTYGFTKGLDIIFHLQRIEAITEGLKAGQFPVRMSSTHDDGYGYPVSVFYGDLLLYAPALLRLIGFSVSTAYKAYIFIVNLLTSFVAFYCCRQIFSEKIAYMASAAYVLSNFRLVDIYVTAGVGGYTAMIFFPIVALAIYHIYHDAEDLGKQESQAKILDGREIKNAITLAIGMLGILYSHVLSTSMVTIVLIVIALAFWKRTFNKKVILTYLLAVLFAVLAGMAFYVPFLDYYLNAQTLISQGAGGANHIQQYGCGLIDFFTFFKPASGYAGTTVITDRMQDTPGPVLMLALIGAIALWIKGRASKELKCYTVTSLALLLLATNIFPWNQFAELTKLGTFMSQIQFPTRYIGLAIAVMMLLLGQLLTELSYSREDSFASKYYIVTVLMFSAFFSALYTNGFDQEYFIDREEIPWYTDVVTHPCIGTPEYQIAGTDISLIDHEVHTDHSQATIISESGVDMGLAVSVTEADYIEIPRFAYPNYVARDNQGNELELTKGDNNTIRILVPETYEGEITVSYVEPWYWRAAELISVAFVLLVVLSYIRYAMLGIHGKDSTKLLL